MKKDLQDKVDAAQALVLQLTAAEREALNQADGGSSSWDPNSLDPASANARALAAVRYATSKVKIGQYVWSSAGPTNFDCSGLMLAAYRGTVDDEGAGGAFLGANGAIDAVILSENQAPARAGQGAPRFEGIAASRRLGQRPFEGQAGHFKIGHISAPYS